MIKHIDEPDVITGFAYTNKDGDTESVVYDWDMVSICIDVDIPLSAIYIEDIPSLIKALQAAYDYKQGK